MLGRNLKKKKELIKLSEKKTVVIEEVDKSDEHKEGFLVYEEGKKKEGNHHLTEIDKALGVAKEILSTKEKDKPE